MEPVLIQPREPWFHVVLEDAIVANPCKLGGIFQRAPYYLKGAPSQERLELFGFWDGGSSLH